MFLTSLVERNQELNYGNIIQGACTSTDSSNPDLASDPAAGKAKWGDPLDWPLHESGIRDL